MSLKIPGSMEGCLYFTNRSIGEGYAKAWAYKPNCPKCKKPMTIGVAERVEMLADRPEGFVPKNAVPFRNIIPLSEVIAGTIGEKVESKKVWAEYFKLLGRFGNEFEVLLDADKRQLEKVSSEKIASNILKNKSQKIAFKPGYDGVYGVPIFEDSKNPKQAALKEFFD